MGRIGHSRQSLAIQRKLGRLGLLLSLLVPLLACAPASASPANGWLSDFSSFCSDPRAWTEDNNPYNLKSGKYGVYIAVIHKIISAGIVKFKNRDFYMETAERGEKSKKVYLGEYLSSDIMHVEIIEKFSGEFDIGSKFVVLESSVLSRVTWLGEDEGGWWSRKTRYDFNAKDVISYDDSHDSKKKYILFVSDGELTSINPNTGDISNTKSRVPKRYAKEINKFLNKFIWVTDCHRWSVDRIYSGYENNAVKAFERILGPRKGASPSADGK